MKIEVELENCRAWNTKVLAEMGLSPDSIKQLDGSPIWARTLHHAIPIEPLYESFETRIQAILNTKSLGTQAERLMNFRLIPKSLYAALPVEFVKAWAEYDKAGDEHIKARTEYDKARAEYNKAGAEYIKALRSADLSVFFGSEMPPNTWNGKTLTGVPWGN